MKELHDRDVLTSTPEVSPHLLDTSCSGMRRLQETTLAIRIFPKSRIDGNARSSRDNTRLPQAAADSLAYPSPVLDVLLGADYNAADGRTQTLREAQADGVETGAEVAQGPGAGGDGLPETRTVAVHED